MGSRVYRVEVEEGPRQVTASRSAFVARLFYAYQDVRIGFGALRVVASTALTMSQPQARLGLVAVGFGLVSLSHALWVRRSHSWAPTSTVVIDIVGYAAVAVIVAAPAVTALVLAFNLFLVVVFSGDHRQQPWTWAAYLATSALAVSGAANEGLARWQGITVFTQTAPVVVMALTIGYVVAIAGREVGRIEMDLTRSLEERVALVDLLPIAVWEADYSGFAAFLQGLPAGSEEELVAWLQGHGDAFRASITSSTVLSGNRAFRDLMGMRISLPGRFVVSVGGRDLLDTLLPFSAALWTGATDFWAPLSGPAAGAEGLIHVHVPVSGGRPDYSRCLIMRVDLTDFHRLRRMLDLESAAYAALLEATTEEEMFERVCAATVQVDGLVGAWVGVVEGDSPVVRIVSAAAAAGHEVPQWDVRADDSPEGGGPSGRAIRTRRTVVMKAGQAWQGPWESLVSQNSVEEIVSVPLLDGDRVLGVLSAVSTVSGNAPDTLLLLERIARYLSIAVAGHRANRGLDQVNVELERLLADKDEFIATVSHELRTPLATVFGLAQQLDERWDEFSEPERQEFVHLVAFESAELSGLVEDLLVAARADDHIRLRLEPVSLRAMCQLLPSADAVVWEPGDAVALADPLRVRQVLRNLLSNARRYGGPNVHFSFADGDLASVTVADDGPGVAAGAEERIFAPFVSAPSTNASPAAIGLGLTVSRRLASLMGGRIEYERRDGWTRFTLILPSADV